MSAARGFPAFGPKPGRRGRSWWAREFVAAMEDAALDHTLLRRGRRFAGSGRLGPIAVSPGRISAVADDPDDGPVDVAVGLHVFDDADWDRFLDQVAAEAGHLAALLEGDVPRELVRAADAAGVTLLPGIGDLESDCGCPDIGDPCVHAAALCYQTAWLLDEDPLVLLLLRGHGGEEITRDVVGASRRSEPPTEVAAEAGRDEGAGAERLDRPVDAAAAYAAPRRTPPARPRPVDAATGPHPVAVPPAPGLAEDLFPVLAAGAADRARALLRAHPSTRGR